MTWQQLRSELERLLDADADSRAQRLAELRASDAALAAQLAELLAHDASTRTFLERGPAPLRAPETVPQPGLRVGPYRLLRPLGAGGMGSVWEAERDNPQRRVALKMLASNAWSRAERWRFEHETQVLAGLAHPAIAQLYEAGTDGELSWFAMELVADARDLVTWADERKAPREQRLAQFARLCDAVQYGHRRGVIHRDLKPANVLVDGDGRLKLIDFGVARALAGPQATPSLRTRTGEIVGTLQYMPPEQAAGRLEDVDARADVYSLGVILYRLLAGALPFDFAGRSLADIARIVQHGEPRRPSQVRAELAGDLDWILLRCLEKNPARRYQSVAELANDLERSRAHEPILARPPSRADLVRRFVRRNGTAVAVAIAIAGGLAFAAFGLVSGLSRARAGERAAQLSAQQASREARRSRSVLDLVEGLFEGIEDTVDGRDVRVADLLDAAALAPGAIADPSVEFEVCAVRGAIYFRLMLFEKARDELARALELVPRLTAGSVAGERILQARVLLASARTRTGESARGEAEIRAALQQAREQGEARAEGEALLALARLLEEKGASAELLERCEQYDALVHRTGVRPVRGDARVLKALALSGLQRHDEALPLLEDLWRTREATAGPRDKRVVSARFHYANALEIAGKAVEAEQHFAALVDVAREVLGPAHGLTLTSLTNAATLAFHRGDRQTGIERMRAAVAAFDARGLLPTHEHVVAINNLGQMLAATDRLAEAEPHLRRAAQLSRDLLAEDDANAILMRLNWGVCLVRLQRWPEAEPVLAEFERLDRLLPRDHPDRRRIVRAAASACEQAGHAEAAAEWRRRL